MSAHRVFLSHTGAMARLPADRSFVAAAIDAVNEAARTLHDMRYFTASDQTPAELCRRKIRECGVYVGIFGLDYGSPVREQPDVSYTELEFLTAIEQRQQGRMLVFIFLLNEKADHAGLDPLDPRQDAFRKRVLNDYGLTARYFSNPDQLQHHVFRALTEELPPVVGPAALTPRPLPPCPVCFFGREVELRDLLDRLVPADASARVPALPLSGIGGMGKSTLILNALHHKRVLDRYGPRRHFVRLEGASSRATVLTGLAETIGLPLGERLEKRLLDHLGSAGPRLLVLDNAETPLLADDRLETEELFQQLANLPALALVATLRGVYSLGPGWAEPLELRCYSDSAARDTFLAQSGTKFATDTDLGTLLALVHGWPLAATILGYRARFVARLSELVVLWQKQRSALLNKGLKKRDADIGTCIELSLGHAQMSEGARRVASLLGLLPDGIHGDDLEELLPGEGTLAAMTLRQVGGLAYDDVPRLRVLAPIREYLAINHPPEVDDRDRAVGFYCDRAKTRGNKAREAGGAGAIQEVATEVGNLTTMVRLGLQVGDLRRAVDGALGLGEFGRFSGVDLSILVQEAAETAGQAGDLLSQANCIGILGHIALARSEHAGAHQAFERALPLYEQAASLLGQANCLLGLGEIARCRSEHDLARQAFEQALLLYEQVGSLRGEANCIQSLGDLVLERSEHDLAREAFERALPLYEQVGDLLGQANCIRSLGNIALERSDHATARQAYERALPLFEQAGSLLDQANCIQAFGNLALAQAEYEAATQQFTTAIPMYRQVGDLEGEGECLRGLGDVAAAQKQASQADQYYHDALSLFERFGNPQWVGQIHQRLAQISNGEERQRHVQAAREAWSSINRPDLLALLDREFGLAG